MGKLTMTRKLPEMKSGSWLICEALDEAALETPERFTPRQEPMPQSLVIFDQLGAGEGDLVAFTEGPEAANPFWPDKLPLAAATTALIDQLTVTI
jgi:ethanolamine utilization protein EutN